MKNIPTLLAKSVMVTLGLTVAASTADAGIHKRVLGSGTITLIISNKEMTYIMKIVKSLKDSDLWIKGISQIIENEKKYITYIRCRLIGKYVAGKRLIRVSNGEIKAGQHF